MSLETLRQMGRDGGKPTGILKIVVGKRLPSVSDSADVIAVDLSDQPQHMDWRAVVGLPAALFVCPGADTHAEKVFDALMAAGCRPIGAAWCDVAVSTDEPTQSVLSKFWSALCR